MYASIFTVKLLAMYTRRFALPDHSFFLFGPRGTGKTTWLRHLLPEALWFDLLRTQTVLDLSRDPRAFRQRVEAAPPDGWIVVDEVQRMPSLLNEVHALISERRRDYRFALSGSSARKLKRLDVNLLAGRAINRHLLPLTAAELGNDVEVDAILEYGLLPQVRAEPRYVIDVLDAYVANYVREEIQQEAVVKNLESFARFLPIAALLNAQVVNVASVARDAAVARPTVQGYFAALVDTLIGFWLPAWRRHAKVKEVARPKFYLFDPGVVRALAGLLREPLHPTERGSLLETWILHELRATMEYENLGGQLSYWGTPSGGEVDFVWTRGQRAVGIEVKAGTRWRREYGSTLKELVGAGILDSAHGVFTGEEPLRDGPVRVWPVKEFLRRLSSGEIIG